MTADIAKDDALEILDFIEELIDALEHQHFGSSTAVLASVRRVMRIVRAEIDANSPARREWLLKTGLALALAAGRSKNKPRRYGEER